MPARKRQPRRNQRCRSCCCRSWERRPVLGKTTCLPPGLARPGVMLGGVQPPVTTQPIGRPRKALLRRRQAAPQLGMLHANVIEELVATDEATFDCVQQQLAPKLGRLAGFVAPDHLGVRLEQAEDLLLTGHRLALEDAAGGLRNRLVDHGEEVLEAFDQAVCGGLPLLLQGRMHALRLRPAGRGDVNQLGVRLLQVLGRLFALAPRDAVVGPTAGRYGSACGTPPSPTQPARPTPSWRAAAAD